MDARPHDFPMTHERRDVEKHSNVSSTPAPPAEDQRAFAPGMSCKEQHTVRVYVPIQYFCIHPLMIHVHTDIYYIYTHGPISCSVIASVLGHLWGRRPVGE